jgi:DNA modification methylase
MGVGVKLLCGDVLDMLKTIPDQTVQCVVTSPPYYGLRDYGTAKWEEVYYCEDCKIIKPISQLKNGCPNCGETMVPWECKHSISNNDADNKAVFSERVSRGDRTVCGKCGAIRIDSQIGLEQTPDAYVAKLVEVFREVRRVLRDDGTLWLNLGDSYTSTEQGTFNAPSTKIHSGEASLARANYRPFTGLKPKDLIGIPWRVAFALQADGWYLRQDIIWAKPNPMPESVKDRCTKSHEYIFLLTKNARYYYDAEAIKEPANYPDDDRKGRAKDNHKSMPDGLRNGLRPGNYTYDMAYRNARDVWTITTKPYKEAHFATFPPEIPEKCIKAGSKPGDVIIDPFNGAGTTGMVAKQLGRDYIGIDLNPEYIAMSEKRIAKVAYQPLLTSTHDPL